MPGLRRSLCLPRRLPKDRFATSPYGEPGQHYLCAGYQAFFGHIQPPMLAMAKLLRARQAPAGLMQAYASQDARRGRNDPCTCGNGRKWKRCHVATPSALLPAPGGQAD